MHEKFKWSESIASCFKQLVPTFSANKPSFVEIGANMAELQGFVVVTALILLSIILHYETGFLVTAGRCTKAGNEADLSTTRQP